MRTRILIPTLLILSCCAGLAAQNTRRVVIVNDHGVTTIDKEAVALGALAKGSCDNFTLIGDHGQRNPCKPFIGVGTNTDAEAGGLVVDYTVDNTPATRFDVRKGDIILAIDGVPVKTQSELVRQRDTHQPGDAFTLTIRRDGAQSTLNLRFRECSEEEKKQFEEAKQRRQEMVRSFTTMAPTMEDRAILGVYEADESPANGMAISEAIEGKGAAKAGLREGDVIVQVDGKPVSGTSSLRAALAGHKAGEAVEVVYLRDGQQQRASVELSGSRSNVYVYKFERDPCAVFIGVYTGDHGADGRGVRVHGVIDGTPAEESAVQAGDVILELDGAPVNTHLELRRERDKHKPGDTFRLTLLRDGQQLSVDARFKPCDKRSDVTPVTEEKVTLLPTEEKPNTDAKSLIRNPLEVTVFEAFPNPTYGLVNVRFEAEAVPTVVRVLDATGKMVYNNTINDFNGFFNEEIDLAGKAPGTYSIVVTQGDKVAAKNIVLLPRA